MVDSLFSQAATILAVIVAVVLGSLFVAAIAVMFARAVHHRRVRLRRRRGLCVHCAEITVKAPAYFCTECGKASAPDAPAAKLYPDPDISVTGATPPGGMPLS